MKKLCLLSVSLVLLLIAGCQLSGTVDVNTDSITINSLSKTSQLVDAGDEVTVYFGFSASEYITQNDVNIIIKNSAGVDVTSAFDVDVSHFSEMSSTAASKNCYYTVMVDSNCVNGTYTVDLDITVGTKKDTKSFALYVGTISELSIQKIETAEIVAGSTKTDTISATVLNGLFLSKDDFTVNVDGNGGKPTVEILSYANGILLMEVSAQSAPTGLYSCILSITDHAVSKGFTLSVVDVETAQIVSVENLTLDKGSSATTSAVIASGSGLTIGDFKVVVAGSGSSSSTTVSPTASVTSFINGVATIAVNATSADAGTYSATLSVGGSAKSFVITVEGEIDHFITLSSSVTSIELEPGEEVNFDLKLHSSIAIPNDSIQYIVKDDNGHTIISSGIIFALTPFNDDSITIKSSFEASSTAIPGNYTVTIYALGAIDDAEVDIDVTITSTPATITYVDDATVKAGDVISTSADISANGNTLTTSDFSVSIANDIGGTAPNATVSAYSNERATISIDATNATLGTYTGTLTLGADTENFTVTVESAGTVLTEKSVKLYNPYAKDGFNSAFNMVDGDPVAGDLAVDNIHMVYAAGDSAVADIAVDNSLDIRATNVVAELTSINGGKFVNISKAEYDAATTDIEVKALAATKYFTDNEVIVTDDDDITVDGYFVMKLANNRGFAVVKMTELNKMDTEGSSGNTGYLAIAYKFTAM